MQTLGDAFAVEVDAVDAHIRTCGEGGIVIRGRDADENAGEEIAVKRIFAEERAVRGVQHIGTVGGVVADAGGVLDIVFIGRGSLVRAVEDEVLGMCGKRIRRDRGDEAVFVGGFSLLLVHIACEAESGLTGRADGADVEGKRALFKGRKMSGGIGGDIIDKNDVFKSSAYLFGCHPYHNYSLVATVGAARPKEVFYGNNRADFSFIPGNVAPGLLFRQPDHFENYDDWPFLWGQNEGTIGGNTGYLTYGLAFKNYVGAE